MREIRVERLVKDVSSAAGFARAMRVVVVDDNDNGGAAKKDPGQDPGPGPAAPAAAANVHVRIFFAGVNYADVLMAQGKYQEKPPLPFTPGAECAGVVVSAPPGARSGDGERLRAGARVMVVMAGAESWIVAGSSSSSKRAGAFADEAWVAPQQCLMIPRGWSLRDAAGFAVAAGTAHVGLVHRAGMQAGDVVLVTGASGGTGSAAVLIAKALGCSVIATARGADKCRYVREVLGADTVVDVAAGRRGRDAAPPDLVQTVMQVTGRRGANIVFDTVGGELFQSLLRCIKWSARIVVVGFAGGRIPSVPANVLLVKNSAVVGVYWGAHFRQEPRVIARSFQALRRLAESGRLRPVPVGKECALEQVPQAMYEMASGNVIGKTIVRTRAGAEAKL